MNRKKYPRSILRKLRSPSKLVGTVAGVAAAGVVAGGVSLAAPSFAGSATPTASQTTKTNTNSHQRRARRRIIGIHGSAKVHTKNGYKWVEWQKGTIKSVNSGTMTVTSPDGTTWVWVLSGRTHVRVDGAKSTVSALKADDKVGVAGTEGGNRLALRIVVPKGTGS